jgi:hypothetical protein
MCGDFLIGMQILARLFWLLTASKFNCLCVMLIYDPSAYISMEHKKLNGIVSRRQKLDISQMTGHSFDKE